MKASTVPACTIGGTTFMQRQRVARRAKERTSRPLRTSLLLPGLLFLLIVSIFCYVWTRIKVVQYGYEISSSLRAKEAAAIAHDERTIELGTLRSARQVEKRAREELRMSPPRKDQLVIMR
ncbi:MAG: cell division protein FtsL [Desulfobacterales bacterium]|nr:cell division protein FtsL [Desulfobacterales bacterium]